ncbi:MAG: tetratricopeptide repeat protein, partial [Pyrinomonadaceae bacterium]
RKSLRHKIKIAAIIFSILILCGHGAAHGGWAFGARYLVFIIPLLLDSFFDGETNNFPSLWRGLLFTVSLFFCTVPALTFSFAPPEFAFPHNNFWIPFLIQENWFTPTLGDVLGIPNGFWTILPAIICIFAVFYFVWRDSFDPKQFGIGFLIGIVFVGFYFFGFNFDNFDSQFRRVTIAERFFKPENRLESFRLEAEANNNQNLLQRIATYEWNIADARANAPDNFPYSEENFSNESPTRNFEKAAELQRQGKINEAINILQTSKEKFPFLKCETVTNLAVIYYTSNQKEAALKELESIQPLVNQQSRPLCLRSQFLLGSLYREFNRPEDAQKTFQIFLNNTQNSTDAEIQNYRRQLMSK